jgi:hypothetical protein
MYLNLFKNLAMPRQARRKMNKKFKEKETLEAEGNAT